MKGLGTSPGIGIGRVFLYMEPKLEIKKDSIKDPETEINRFRVALEKCCNEIEYIKNLTIDKIGKDKAEIFSAHRLMLEDPEFISAVNEKINNENINAEFAISEVVDFYISLFDNIEDEYLRARSEDLKHVTKNLLRELMGIEPTNLMTIKEKSIIVSEDLSPSDIAQINPNIVVGIVTELGGRTSHTSIMARTLGIPAIVGIKGIVTKVNHGEDIIIDGSTGDITLSPTSKVISEYEIQLKRDLELKKIMSLVRDKKSISKDGFRVEILGNIGTPKDVEKVIQNGGEGVGLFRTEFLYMNSERLPSEEEQFEAYKEVAEKLGNKSLIIRTLDVGGDKELPYLNLPKEMNPFLGYRAIRLCLDRQEIFRVQLRAILRASEYGNIKIMFPMISNINELRESKKIIEEIKEELKLSGISFNENIEVGIMVEIPAVAIQSRTFAKEVDFFSIGTNDLIQYTLAVDRGNEKIANLYSQYHPAVLNLIKMTIENGHKEGIMVGMCGEAAADENLLPVLLAMGLDEFSMSASSILRSRYLLKSISKEKVREKLDELLNLSSSEEILRFIDENILINVKNENQLFGG